MLRLLRRVHIWLYAYAIKWWRVRHALKVFQELHRTELTQTPFNQWPQVMARQESEVRAIKAGKLDSASQITDRKSWAWPYLPQSVQRLSVPIIKSSPYNLKRMSRTPVPSRAKNLIKGALISQTWEIRPIADVAPIDNEEGQKMRIKIAKKCFAHPNNIDSFQTWLEQGMDDMLCLGAFVSELQLTPDPERPLKMWAVNVESIRLFVSWQESTPDLPHYAQMTGLKGERGALLFYEDEILYIKDNPSTDNPFGLGCMEVAFSSVNDFLGVQGMAGRAGSDQIHKTFLWWAAPQSESHVQIVRRYIQNELEGQAKLSLIAGMQKPDVVDVTPVTEADLLLNWQELLVRMIANAFNMSALALNVTQDINRAVGAVLDDKDFRSAVVPPAKRLQEAFTRKCLHNKLGWTDLEFVFLNLDDPDIETKIDMYSKLYSMNAATPNRVLKALNMQVLDSPLADLTQFECMLLNAEAMAKIQNSSADQAMQRQQQMYQQMQPQQQDQDQGQDEDGTQNQPSQSPQATDKKLAAPKPLSLPKFPIAGSRYNAKQIAMMPINQITDVYQATGQRASSFLKALDSQEPGILSQLTDEVKSFFQQQLDNEQKTKPISPRMINKWQKELKTKVNKLNRRTSDMANYLYEVGKNSGRPGLAGRNPKAGKPGNLSPTQRW